MRDNHTDNGGGVTDGSFQALAIDAIETQGIAAVPEPASLAIWGGIGLAGLVAWRRKRSQVSKLAA